MLGKVLKHEWKSTYKAGGLMLILLVCITFLGWLAFQSPMWLELSSETYMANVPRDSLGVSVLNLASTFTLLFYFIMLVVVGVGITVYLAIHFYRTMYTDEGYLTHTLPVTEGKLLLGKTLISGIWSLLISIGVVVSVLAVLLSMVAAMLPSGYTLGQLWKELQTAYQEELAEIVEMMELMLGMKFGSYFTFLIVSTVISSFTGIMILFGVISLGQLFTRHRVLMAIVFYIGVQIAGGIVSSIVQGIVAAVLADTAINSPAIVGNYYNASMITNLVVDVVFAALLYMASYLVNTRRLNME